MGISALPRFLVEGYARWKSSDYDPASDKYRQLADQGQTPRVFAIGCCDSRVQTSKVFDADPGDIFVHRNIANLVPKFADDAGHHGTVAALDYAVDVLKVSHIVVAGHSQCGGIKACHDLALNPDSISVTPALSTWLKIVGDEFFRVEGLSKAEDRVRALEFISVMTSLENLMTYPNVVSAIESRGLKLHGIWQDLGGGQLMAFDPGTKQFQHIMKC
ncbi:carbonic anhydrase [Sulfitobacter mediterraneus]|uniref:carbonic anhydrase n=1 Tax=Sulfitobacter mediterraneus TaxID=83219 RepID=A0A2T6CJX5_9RHOB|nr:carbonic anhydrase [Sulfitobacter mediterraneus]KIN78766.1 Carbonic anhydrase [Sulfitobacter mediterraneus KCTC 32188]PTX75786.1 carbonic anhydrase [Sulfitobacter mediterraneus]